MLATFPMQEQIKADRSVSDRRYVASYENIEGLDGLRAIAVSIVLVAHFGFYQQVPGGFGVTLFFFISGLLITRLLLAEVTAKGTIGVGNFYIRRALRLYPALLVSIVVGWLTYSSVGGKVYLGELLAALFYYANYYSIYFGFGVINPPANVEMHPYGILWSLAVEEQYYLMFPLIFWVLKGNKTNLLRLIVPVLFGCLALRYFFVFALGAPESRTYAGTDTRLDSILYGALATIILSGAKGELFLELCSRKWVQILAFAAVLFCFLFRDENFRQTLRYSVQGLALTPIIVAVCFSDLYRPVRALLSTKPFRLMGAWSYSLYMLHPAAIIVAEYVTQTNYMSGPAKLPALWYLIAVPLTFTLALSSYYFIEQPFVKLRRRFGSHR